MNTYIGIDNGLDGGIAILSDDGLLTEPMPTVTDGNRRAIDIYGLTDLLSPYQGATVLLEQALKHSPGVLALCSTWRSFGSIETLLQLGEWKHLIIDPKKWQKEFWTKPKLAKGKKFNTKAAALLAAGRIFPGSDFLKTARCSVPHDGMVDAALIAEYGRRKNL